MNGRKLENCLITDLSSVKPGETIYLEKYIVQIEDAKDCVMAKDEHLKKENVNVYSKLCDQNQEIELDQQARILLL